jgi:hypothetical protein
VDLLAVHEALERFHEVDATAAQNLPTGEPHSVKGIESASLLLTILLPKH